MNRRKFIATGGVAGLGSLFLRSPLNAIDQFSGPSATATFEVGQAAQLFVDRKLVERTEGISFTLHPARKHPLNPIVTRDQEWEGWWVRVLGGSVLYDERERLFKMWYFSVSDCFPNFGVHYAISRDGIRWEKPLVGTVKCAQHPRHNVVFSEIHSLGVSLDPDEADPARRYKMIAFDGRKIADGGAHAYVSPDGLAWTRISGKGIFKSADVLTAFFDRRRRLHVAFPKVPLQVKGQRRRCFGITTSKDMLTWTETKPVFVPDDLDDAGTLTRIAPARAILLAPDDAEQMRTEFYGVSTYQAESCTIAFPWVFSINNVAGTRDDGVCEIQIASSRDLDTWERPLRNAAIAPGAPGEWDCGFVTASSEAIRYGDEVRLYYSSQNYSHADSASKEDPGPDRNDIRAIGLATWPLDRFVSADAGQAGGALTTIPLRFSGRRLELNLSVRNGGSARVALLDAAGRPLGGFGKSDPVTGDALRTTVSWNGNSNVGQLSGKPVRLRFELRDAELYSFAFRA